jgi:hypothetical protein
MDIYPLKEHIKYNGYLIALLSSMGYINETADQGDQKCMICDKYVHARACHKCLIYIRWFGARDDIQEYVRKQYYFTHNSCFNAYFEGVEDFDLQSYNFTYDEKSVFYTIKHDWRVYTPTLLYDWGRCYQESARKKFSGRY